MSHFGLAFGWSFMNIIWSLLVMGDMNYMTFATVFLMINLWVVVELLRMIRVEVQLNKKEKKKHG